MVHEAQINISTQISILKAKQEIGTKIQTIECL